MNLLENVQQILLSACIALMIPLLVYWGVDSAYTIYNPKTALFQANKNDVIEEEEKPAEALKVERKKLDYFMMWAYAITAAVMIIGASFLTVGGLSLGFTGGGFLSLFMAFIFSLSTHSSAESFIIFSTLFTVLIARIIIKNVAS